MTEIDKHFKEVFAFELLLHRCENSKMENFQYSKIMLEKTVSGLCSKEKISVSLNEEGTELIITPSQGYENIARTLTKCREIYKALAHKMGEARSDGPGRSWLDGQVLEMCNLIDTALYPIALSEGCLDMSETIGEFVMLNQNLDDAEKRDRR
jgi:hypothetical protein